VIDLIRRPASSSIVERPYDLAMVAGTNEKALRQAHIALIGALRRLDAVMAQVEKSKVKLWPEADGSVSEWSAEDMALVKAASAAWADLVRRRTDYDSAARTVAKPNT
jgi:hypothetical protein